jgi:hypothetical protein
MDRLKLDIRYALTGVGAVFALVAGYVLTVLHVTGHIP